MSISALISSNEMSIRAPAETTSWRIGQLWRENTNLRTSISWCLPRVIAADTMAVPTHAEIRLANGSSKTPSYLFMIDDAPLQRFFR